MVYNIGVVYCRDANNSNIDGAIDKISRLAYNTDVDDSMTVRRHVEAFSRFSVG